MLAIIFNTIDSPILERCWDLENANQRDERCLPAETRSCHHNNNQLAICLIVFVLNAKNFSTISNRLDLTIHHRLRRYSEDELHRHTSIFAATTFKSSVHSWMPYADRRPWKRSGTPLERLRYCHDWSNLEVAGLCAEIRCESVSLCWISNGIINPQQDVTKRCITHT